MNPPLSLDAHTCLGIAGTLLLIWAAIVDVRTRRIPNAAWLIAATGMVPLHAWHIATTSATWGTALAWGAGLTMSSLALWLTRCWAGADAKGTILLAWSIPSYQVGPVITHPLLWSIPISLAFILWWNRHSAMPRPFYAAYAPVTLAAWWLASLL